MTAPTVYHLRNNDGVETFTGTISPAPSGGSQPGALGSTDVLFTETAGAGVYSASVPVTAGAVVLDVIVYPLAAWAADTADLEIGDTLNGSASYQGDVDLSFGLATPYDPADPQPNSNYATLASGTSPTSGYGLSSYSQPANATGADTGYPGPGVRYAADDAIAMHLTTTGAGGTTGRTLVKVIYFVPVTAVAAVKA